MQNERRVSRPGMMLYFADYLAVRDELTQEQKGTLFDNLVLFAMAISGKDVPVEQIPDIEPAFTTDDITVRLCFNLLQEKIRHDAIAYRNKCEKNRENRQAGIAAQKAKKEREGR
jgi:uncharacterized protein YdaU (DUF1376 family)